MLNPKVDADKKKRSRLSIPLPFCGIIMLLLVILAFCGIKISSDQAYNRGVKDGKEETINEYGENLKDLANTVASKNNYANKLEKLTAELPTELDEEGIKQYASKVNEVVSEINQDSKLSDDLKSEIKPIIEAYYNSWNAFAEFYASSENARINEEFNNLKTAAAETAEKLTEKFNAKITSLAQ